MECDVLRRKEVFDRDAFLVCSDEQGLGLDL